MPTFRRAVYTAEVRVQGGVVEIEHNGQPFSFDLDCGKEDVVCPSEVWPAMVEAEQRNESFPHQVHLLLPVLECNMELRAPEPEDCGEGTEKLDCAEVCDGEMVTVEKPVLGVRSPRTATRSTSCSRPEARTTGSTAVCTASRWPRPT